MSEFTLEHYLGQVSTLLGRNVWSLEGLALVCLAAVISAQLMYIVANSLSRGCAEYPRQLLCSVCILLLAPLCALGLNILIEHTEMSLRTPWTLFLPFFIAAVVVICFPAARGPGCDLYSGFLSVLPSSVLIFFLIILFNQMDETLVSGSEKAGVIKSRTVELDQFLE